MPGHARAWLGKCADCLARSRRPRASTTAQGYGAEHRDCFRAGVPGDPTCVCTEQQHEHGTPCGARREHADHWPQSKRELQSRDCDERDPCHGRGLCAAWHSKETGRHQPAGWNDALPF
ncbi:holin [Streptomyces chartreusis]